MKYFNILVLLLVVFKCAESFPSLQKLALHSFSNKNGFTALSVGVPSSNPESKKSDSKKKLNKLLSEILDKHKEKVPTSADDLCSDSLSHLKNQMGKEIYLIGTAHTSQSSADFVKLAIKKIRPATVMIELDQKRIESINNWETLKGVDYDIPSTPFSPSDLNGHDESNEDNHPFQQLRLILQDWLEQVAGTLIIQGVGLFYSSVEKLGFTVGGEFSAAVEAGISTGSRILLGDRDIDLTLLQMGIALLSTPLPNFLRVSERIQAYEEEQGFPIEDNIYQNKELLSEYVETLKQRKHMAPILGILEEEVPHFYNALIGERDEFMANGLVEAFGQSVVAVVGIAHLVGIEKHLKEKGYSIIDGNCL